MMQKSFKVQKSGRTPDGEGGFITGWHDVLDLSGYLDLVSGSNQNQYIHHAAVEESTHVLIVPTVIDSITDKMRIVDSKNRAYQVTYVDDPVGIGHHLEIYLKFSEVVDDG